MEVNINNHVGILTPTDARDLIIKFMATSIDLNLPLNRIRTDLIKGYKITYFKNKNSHRFTIPTPH